MGLRKNVASLLFIFLLFFVIIGMILEISQVPQFQERVYYSFQGGLNGAHPGNLSNYSFYVFLLRILGIFIDFEYLGIGISDALRYRRPF